MKLKYLFEWMQVQWTKLEIPWLKREIHYLDVGLKHDIQMLEIIHQHEIEAVTREITRKRDIAIGKLARAKALTQEFSPEAEPKESGCQCRPGMGKCLECRLAELPKESLVDFSEGQVRG